MNILINNMCIFYWVNIKTFYIYIYIFDLYNLIMIISKKREINNNDNNEYIININNNNEE